MNGEASDVNGDKMQEAIILRDPPTKGVRDFMLSVKVASSAPYPQHPSPGCLCVYPHVQVRQKRGVYRKMPFLAMLAKVVGYSVNVRQHVGYSVNVRQHCV